MIYWILAPVTETNKNKFNHLLSPWRTVTEALACNYYIYFPLGFNRSSTKRQFVVIIGMWRCCVSMVGEYSSQSCSVHRHETRVVSGCRVPSCCHGNQHCFQESRGKIIVSKDDSVSFFLLEVIGCLSPATQVEICVTPPTHFPAPYRNLCPYWFVSVIICQIAL